MCNSKEFEKRKGTQKRHHPQLERTSKDKPKEKPIQNLHDQEGTIIKGRKTTETGDTCKCKQRRKRKNPINFFKNKKF